MTGTWIKSRSNLWSHNLMWYCLGVNTAVCFLSWNVAAALGLLVCGLALLTNPITFKIKS